MDPFARTSSINWKECEPNEEGTCLSLDLTCALLEDNQSVNMYGWATLHADEDWSQEIDITLAPGQIIPYEYHAADKEVCGTDRGDIWIRFRNVPQY